MVDQKNIPCPQCIYVITAKVPGSLFCPSCVYLFDVTEDGVQDIKSIFRFPVHGSGSRCDHDHMAFGPVPSWATREPEVEAEVNVTTSRFLFYRFAEVSPGPSDRGWSVILSLHHRSKAFGLVAKEGDSNTLAAGTRFDYSNHPHTQPLVTFRAWLSKSARFDDRYARMYCM